jgi:hypothetical protein
MERIEKLERAVNLILALDGQKEVAPGRHLGVDCPIPWVVRLDPMARKQLEDALKK